MQYEIDNLQSRLANVQKFTFRSLLITIYFNFICLPIFSFFLIIVILFELVFHFFPFKSVSRKLSFVLIKLILGISGIYFDIRGLEHTKRKGALFLSKHDSFAETILIGIFLENAVAVLKKTLFFIPFWNLYFIMNRYIITDRKFSIKSLLLLVKSVKRRLDLGKNVFVFPEATRVPLGQTRKFHLGLVKLYPEIDIIPIAINVAPILGRRPLAFKRPGTVVIEFLPPIPSHLTQKQAREYIEKTILSNSRKLLKEFLEDWEKKYN